MPFGVTCDVTNDAQVSEMVHQAREAFGGIDILVNNAVIFNQKGVLDMPLDEWSDQIAVILTGAFLCTKRVSNLMIEQGTPGSIINIISTAGHQGQPGNVGYCTGKSGLLNFTRSVAMELAPHGIRVNSLTPTATDSSEAVDRANEWGIDGGGTQVRRAGRTLPARRADGQTAATVALCARRRIPRVRRRGDDNRYGPES